MNIYDVIQQQGIDAISENARASQGILGQQQDLANQNVDLATGAMPAALGVSAQKNLGELQAQENARLVAAKLGNDPNDPNSLLSILVQDFHDNTIAARAQREAITAKKQVGIFDDVIQFMMNQVTLPDEINAYNATLDKANAAKASIAEMQSLTTAAAQAQQATKQTLTKDSIRQQAEVDTALLSQKINALKSDALGYDLESMKIANNTNAQRVQYAMQMHSIQMQEAAADRASEMHQLQLKKWRESDLGDDQYEKIISVGAKMLGQTAPNSATIKAMKNTPEQKAILDVWFNQGMTGVSLGIPEEKLGSMAVGSTPGESIVNALRTGGLKGAETKVARDFMTKVYEDALGSLEQKERTPANVARKVNELLYGAVNPKTGKPDPKNPGLFRKLAGNTESEGNPLKAPSLDVLAKESLIQGNVLFESVIKPAVETGVKNVTPEMLHSLALGAVVSGKINENQLKQGMADFYKSVTAINYKNSGAAKFGLPYLAEYKAKVPDPFGMGDLQLDWTKEENWGMYGLRKQTSTKLDKATFGAGLWR